MAIGPVAGQVIDLYREHLIANSATYTSAQTTDDFHTNATNGTRTYNANNNSPVAPYVTPYPGNIGGVVVVDSWIMQLRQRIVQQ